MENSIKSSAINYGLYLGGALSLVTIAIWFIDINLMANMWLGIIILLAIVAFGVVSTAKAKSIQEGILTFKEAFTVYFLTVAIGIAISSLVSMILFNYVDPEAAKQIQQITVDATISFMEGIGAPPESIAEAVDRIESQNQYSIANTLKSIAWGLVLQAIIGLIVGLIMKRTDADA